MIEIIEVPVMTLISQPGIENDFESLIKAEVDRNYDGFRFLERTFKENKSIYLYFLENAIENDDYVIWDRIIPKAPFSLVLFDWFYQDFDRMITAYQDRYETPLVFVTFSAPPNSQKITSQILKKGDIRVIFAEKNSDDGIDNILLQAIKFTYPQIMHE